MIANLIAAQADLTVDDDDIDRRVAEYLVSIDRIPAFEAGAVVLPGWRRPSAAAKLLGDLLPGWRLTTIRGDATVVITSPNGTEVSSCGATMARAILAATFEALKVGIDLDPAVGPMADLRDALIGELADG